MLKRRVLGGYVAFAEGKSMQKYMCGKYSMENFDAAVF